MSAFLLWLDPANADVARTIAASVASVSFMGRLLECVRARLPSSCVTQSVGRGAHLQNNSDQQRVGGCERLVTIACARGSRAPPAPGG